jgi:hypothetical protein
MKVLTTNINQSISIIPTRESDGINDIYLEFTNDTTKEVFLRLSTVRTYLNDLLTIGSNNLNFLVQDNFYNLKVYFQNTNEVIYKDRIFCTNQSKATYSINNLEYTLPNIDNNDYITI